jgi:chromosomal replication initiation ATPase DnaA
MDSFQAQHIIESLRLGIPPEGYVRQFTVGRTKEIEDLIKRLQVHNETAVLLMANYGSGKTHLLKYIREESLERNMQ